MKKVFKAMAITCEGRMVELQDFYYPNTGEGIDAPSSNTNREVLASQLEDYIEWMEKNHEFLYDEFTILEMWVKE